MVIKAKDVRVDLHGVHISITADKKDLEGLVNGLSRLKLDVEYDVEIKERARRSLSANAYHWVLVQRIAQANGVSNAEVHNVLLADYGEDWIDASGRRTYVLMRDDDSYLRMETMHYRPTDATEDRKGVMYRWFILLLPSHLMNRQQMARLIDGTVQEAQALDIETRTPAELAQLVEKWDGGIDNGRG